MVKFMFSDSAQRKIRCDDWNKLGVSTWAFVDDAIRAGRVEEALELAEYGRSEVDHVRLRAAEFANNILSSVADIYGEEHMEQMWRDVARRHVQLRTSRTPPNIEEMVRLQAELQRGHCSGPSGRGDITVTDEGDRFVLTLDPCGSGGRMRKTGLYGTTKKAYTWSWGKVGVPYYCTHCCVYWEILMIEERGYPVRVHENVDAPEKPCIQIFYKSPELIPEHCFTRVGKRRDPSKFKK